MPVRPEEHHSQSDPESGECSSSEEEGPKRLKSLVKRADNSSAKPSPAVRNVRSFSHSPDRSRKSHVSDRGSQSPPQKKSSQLDDSPDSRREQLENNKENVGTNTPRKRKADDDGTAEKETPLPKKKKDTTDMLQTRTGGAYIPPAKLRMMQAKITDKASIEYQRLSWEALKKSINGLVNKVNVSNIIPVIRQLLAENVVRGRGLLARAIIQAQAASPTFTHVYAALVSIINSKFPQIGELILRRLIIQFRKGYRRNDKSICLSATRFVAHLVNQQVAHEVVALEIITLLLEEPSDDSVEVAIGFLQECGMKLTDVSPRGMHAIFDRLRNVLHEAKIEKRVQYMVEVVFQVRKDGFKDNVAVVSDLEIIEEEDQFTHMMSLEEQVDPEDILNVFKFDPDFLANDDKYKEIKKDMTDDSSDDDDESGSGSDSGSSSHGSEDEESKQLIIDATETNLVALRRTIYLTIQSSLDFEECAHKLLKMNLKPGQEVELCNMILDCCAQQRTYEKFFGLLAQRFCQLNKVYIEPFEAIFREQYETIHRLETNKLRNVAKFFAHLLHTDAISWAVIENIRLNPEDTTSSSRIFIKILFQELSDYLSLTKLNGRLKDETLQMYFEGLLPRDNPKNTRFAINFFTTIGLGGLTDDLRDHLKTASKLMAQKKLEEKSSSESSSSSSDSSSGSSSDSDSSSSSSNSDKEKEPRKKKLKNKKPEKLTKDLEKIKLNDKNVKDRINSNNMDNRKRRENDKDRSFHRNDAFNNSKHRGSTRHEENMDYDEDNRENFFRNTNSRTEMNDKNSRSNHVTDKGSDSDDVDNTDREQRFGVRSKIVLPNSSKRQRSSERPSGKRGTSPGVHNNQAASSKHSDRHHKRQDSHEDMSDSPGSPTHSKRSNTENRDRHGSPKRNRINSLDRSRNAKSPGDVYNLRKGDTPQSRQLRSSESPDISKNLSRTVQDSERRRGNRESPERSKRNDKRRSGNNDSRDRNRNNDRTESRDQNSSTTRPNVVAKESFENIRSNYMSDSDEDDSKNVSYTGRKDSARNVHKGRERMEKRTSYSKSNNIEEPRENKSQNKDFDSSSRERRRIASPIRDNKDRERDRDRRNKDRHNMKDTIDPSQRRHEMSNEHKKQSRSRSRSSSKDLDDARRTYQSKPQHDSSKRHGKGGRYEADRIDSRDITTPKRRENTCDTSSDSRKPRRHREASDEGSPQERRDRRSSEKITSKREKSQIAKDYKKRDGSEEVAYKHKDSSDESDTRNRNSQTSEKIVDKKRRDGSVDIDRPREVSTERSKDYGQTSSGSRRQGRSLNRSIERMEREISRHRRRLEPKDINQKKDKKDALKRARNTVKEPKNRSSNDKDSSSEDEKKSDRMQQTKSRSSSSSTSRSRSKDSLKKNRRRSDSSTSSHSKVENKKVQATKKDDGSKANVKNKKSRRSSSSSSSSSSDSSSESSSSSSSSSCSEGSHSRHSKQNSSLRSRSGSRRKSRSASDKNSRSSSNSQQGSKSRSISRPSSKRRSNSHTGSKSETNSRSGSKSRSASKHRSSTRSSSRKRSQSQSSSSSSSSNSDSDDERKSRQSSNPRGKQKNGS